MRHPTTGGGDAVQFTSSEEVLASTMQGHPVVQGLTGGVDSDVVASQTRIWALATGSNPEQKASSYASQRSESAITASCEEHNDSARNVSKGVKRKEAFKKKADKRLSSNALTTLTTANMEKDIEKLNLEIHKLTLEIEKIQMEKTLLHLKIKNEEQYSLCLQAKTLYYNGRVLNSM
ncbi:uncharacterized protein LOC127838632 isoform X2 [Dreissena polymorpha]|nr:uncharacterized protein LOC127838632 isoform X2 [Dreissena polymorpha]XP_052222444.1 uncharacterized protein LOC127838632 isoform X2 [Dreissena polymorpha]XP_052222445.1 uncharacterized protein LOC127838632 isoform X2 [Dreissena polymorpha]